MPFRASRKFAQPSPRHRVTTTRKLASLHSGWLRKRWNNGICQIHPPLIYWLKLLSPDDESQGSLCAYYLGTPPRSFPTAGPDLITRPAGAFQPIRTGKLKMLRNKNNNYHDRIIRNCHCTK